MEQTPRRRRTHTDEATIEQEKYVLDSFRHWQAADYLRTLDSCCKPDGNGGACEQHLSLGLRVDGIFLSSAGEPIAIELKSLMDASYYPTKTMAGEQRKLALAAEEHNLVIEERTLRMLKSPRPYTTRVLRRIESGELAGEIQNDDASLHISWRRPTEHESSGLRMLATPEPIRLGATREEVGEYYSQFLTGRILHFLSKDQLSHAKAHGLHTILVLHDHPRANQPIPSLEGNHSAILRALARAYNATSAEVWPDEVYLLRKNSEGRPETWYHYPTSTIKEEAASL